MSFLTLCILGLLIYFQFLICPRNLPDPGKRIGYKENYQNNLRIIHKRLFQIYTDARCEKINEAENTFLDLQQLWYRQDLLAKFNKDPQVTQLHFPSDSLIKLKKLLEHMQQDPSHERFKLVAQEIKRIQQHLDQVITE